MNGSRLTALVKTSVYLNPFCLNINRISTFYQVLLCIYQANNYAQNIREFIARMDATKTSDPELWQSFNNGEFAVNTSNRIPFTRIGVDQEMEHMNKSTKGQGRISGIASYPATLLKICLTASEQARLSEES